jgi:hypothetical protein
MFPIHCNTIEAYFWVKRVKLVKLVDSTFLQRPYAQTTLETWGETSGWESLERWGVAGKGIPPWAPVSVLADCWRGLARVRVRLWYDESGIWLRLLALITAGSCVKILRERNYLVETWVLVVLVVLPKVQTTSIYTLLPCFFEIISTKNTVDWYLIYMH